MKETMRAGNFVLVFLFSLLVFDVVMVCNARGRVRVEKLKMNFYQTSCPEAEDIVKRMTWSSVGNNSGLAAKLLRMHYHDCFVTGCDASILLDTVDNASPAEKEAIPNRSLFGFDVIEDIKTEIEKECPGVVSCADILALAARDAIAFQSKKPKWVVPTGRRDGTISLASRVSGNLPSPFANFSGLMEVMINKGLNVRDLVILSAAHTVGVAHCGIFFTRLYNFTGKGDADPSLETTYADLLRSKCPNPANPSVTVEMDPGSSLTFDNSYFSILLEHKGLFTSDAALLTNEDALKIVKKFRKSNSFFGEFSNAMERMGAMDVLVGNEGEIRKRCNAIN